MAIGKTIGIQPIVPKVGGPARNTAVGNPVPPKFRILQGDQMLVGAFAVIVVLTWILVIMNVRAVVQQFAKDQNAIRLYSYLATLLVLASMIIGVAGAVLQRVIDSESYLQLDTMSPVVNYRR